MTLPNTMSWSGLRAGRQPFPGIVVSRSWILAMIAGSLGVVPLFVAHVAPLMDWPSHLARIQILADVLAGPSPWSRFYEVHGFLLPNVVLDGLILLFLKLGFGIDLAGQAFLLLLYLVFVGGFLRLAAAFGAGGPLKLMLGTLLFYNGPLFYGLVNFEFGLGLVMLFVGSWLGSGARWQLILASFGTVAVFECHLVAAFLYAGVLGVLALHALRLDQGRGLLRCLGPAGLALALLLVLLLLSPTGHDGFVAVWDDDDSFASFWFSKTRLFAKTLLGGSFQSDLVFVIGAALVALAAVVGCRIRLSWPVASLVVATGAATLAAPGHLGAGSLLDYRMAIMPWLFLGAGLAVSPRAAWCRRLLLGTMFVLVLARGVALASSWRAADAEFVTLAEMMEKLPRNSVLFVGRGRLPRDVPWREFWAFPYNTIPAYAVRYGVFVPSVYAHPAQQPLVLKPAYQYFKDFNDVSSAALLDRLQQQAEVRALCHDFPAGVAMVVLFPTAAGLPGMVRVGTRFGLLDMCVDRTVTSPLASAMAR